MLFEQLLYLGILIIIGSIVLSLRRKANGSRTGYKLVLLFLGLLLGMLTVSGTRLINFDAYFLKTVCVFLLVVLLFELSVRLNHENVVIDYRNVGMFVAILITNILLLGVLSAYILRVSPIHAAVLALILSSVEYFLVDALKGEGDLANPLVIIISFSIMVFYGLQGDIFENVIYFLQYIFIGLAMGVFMGIIVFRILRYRQISMANELGMVAVAGITYMVTDQLHGSGLFAIMILGIFFGNSYVRKTSSMHSFSPKIFKTIEMMIYLFIGFVATLTFDNGLWWKALVIFAGYLIVRFVLLCFYYRHYSIQNKLLLSFAPKGMILGIMILVLGVFGSFESSLITVMVFILGYSLLAGVFVEYIEQERTSHAEKVIRKAVNRVRRPRL